MKRVLYIDFENVSQQGLRGIQNLTKNDLVRIFLGPKCSKMSLIDADLVFHCDATVELIKNDQIGKNALDFIIMVHLGYDIAKKTGNAYYVVSNDKGYEPAINEMKSMTGCTIERLPDVDAVIARGGEVRTGLLAFLHRVAPTPVADNTTQHEVIGKGTHKTTRRVVGNGNTSRTENTHTNAGSRNSGNRGRSGQMSGGTGSGQGRTQTRSGQNTQAQAAPARGNAQPQGRNQTAKTQPAAGTTKVTATVGSPKVTATVGNTTKLPETPAGSVVNAETQQARPAEEGTASKRKKRAKAEPVTTPEAKAAAAAAGEAKRRARAAARPVQDEEEIFRKGVETCKTKLEFHNYLAKVLDNKEHIQELYNRGKKLIEVDAAALRRENGMTDEPAE